MSKENNIEEVEINTALDDFLEKETLCCLCGSELEFQYELDFQSLKMKEEGRCSSCKVQLRSQEHTLH